MIDRDSRIEQRQKNKDEIKDYSTAADEILARRIDRAQKSLQRRDARIKELQEERFRLMESALSKKDFIVEAKKAFEARRQESIMAIGSSLSESRSRNTKPFQGTRFTLSDMYWDRFLMGAIDPAIIDAALESLPEGGLSAKDRDKRIAEIDAEIDSIREEAHRELEAERASV